MNDEIKEILEHLKEYLQSKIDNGEHKIFYNNLMWDIKTIDCINAIDDSLDYITNLQQAVKDTKDTADDMLYELKQENERLKQEYINVRNYIKMRKANTEVEDKALLYNMELENINKKKYLDYKSRCEKASEYIKENKVKTYAPYGDNEDTDYDICLVEREINDLLNILQKGSDE